MNESDRARYLTALEEERVLDGLVEAFVVGAFASRESLAADLGVPPDCLAVASSLEALTRDAVAAVLEPDQVLALAEPCREAWLRAALAAGGRYLDVGRDQGFRPLDEALDRALGDGVVQAVVIEHPGVLGGETLDLPDAHEPFLFVDQTASRCPEVAVDTGVLHLGQTGGVPWAVGTPELVAALDGTVDALQRASSGPGPLESLARALEASGGRLQVTEPAGVALRVHLPGVSGDRLAKTLEGCGVEGVSDDRVHQALEASGGRPWLDTRPRLHQIRCPVAMIHGVDDDVIPVEQMDKLTAAFPAGHPVTAFRTGWLSHAGRAGLGQVLGAIPMAIRELMTMGAMLRSLGDTAGLEGP